MQQEQQAGEIFLFILGTAPNEEYRQSGNKPDKPESDGLAKSLARGQPRGGGPSIRTHREQSLRHRGDNRMDGKWPTDKALRPQTAEELKQYITGFQWILKDVKTGKKIPVYWETPTPSKQEQIKKTAKIVQTSINTSLTEARTSGVCRDAMGLPQSATIVSVEDFWLVCKDPTILLEGPYDIVLQGTPLKLFWQFSRPVTALFLTLEKLMALVQTPNATVALLHCQNQWFWESYFEGSPLDPYDRDGMLKSQGDPHGSFQPSVKEIIDMPYGKFLNGNRGICSQTSPASFRCTGARLHNTGIQETGASYGSTVELSGITMHTDPGEKTKQICASSENGPPLLKPGQGLLVSVRMGPHNITMFQSKECVICLSEIECNPHIINCGHAAFCTQCLKTISQQTCPKCPLCRKSIQWVVEVVSPQQSQVSPMEEVSEEAEEASQEGEEASQEAEGAGTVPSSPAPLFPVVVPADLQVEYEEFQKITESISSTYDLNMVWNWYQVLINAKGIVHAKSELKAYYGVE